MDVPWRMAPQIITAEEVGRERSGRGDGGSDEVTIVGLVQMVDKRDAKRLLEWEFRTDQGWADVRKLDEAQPETWAYELVYREYV
jgi:hypothetical protein